MQTQTHLLADTQTCYKPLAGEEMVGDHFEDAMPELGIGR